MSTNVIHNEVDVLRLQLMKAIMAAEDVAQLRAWCQAILPEATEAEDIPVAEVRSGVTLEEIESEQEIVRFDREEFYSQIEAESWDMSLDELLETLE